MNGKPFKFERPDICIKCGKLRALEIYNRFDKPMNYSFMLDRKENIEERVIDMEYLQCKYCKERFFPRWENGVILPLEPINERDFIALFNCNKK